MDCVLVEAKFKENCRFNSQPHKQKNLTRNMLFKLFSALREKEAKHSFCKTVLHE